MSTVAEPATPKRKVGEGDDDEIDKRPRQRARYNYDETISVLLGPHQAKFTAHRDVLCARSQYFSKACTQRWLEGQRKVVPLPEHERETFQMYMDLTYNRLVYHDTSPSLPLVKFYVLVDYLGDFRALNKTLRLLLLRTRCPSPETIGFLWDHTAQGSLLRKWAIDAASANLGLDEFARMVGSYPAEFVQQVALKLMQQTPLATREVFNAKMREHIEVENNT